MARTGRPPVLDRVLAEVEGQPITVGATILNAVKAGNYLETAAHAAGVHKDSVYEWLRVGAAAQAKQGRLSRYEALCLDFSDGLRTALAESEADALHRLDALARGGLTRTTVITKRDKAGEVVEVTERVETLPPDATVETWRLERRFGKRWGRKAEVSGPDGGPITLDLAASAREAIEEKLDEIGSRIHVAAPPAPPEE